MQRIQMSKERQEQLVCYSCWRKKCFLTPQKNQNTSRCCWGFFSFSKLKIRKNPQTHPAKKTLPPFPTGPKPRRREAENEEDMQSIKMFSDQNGRYFNPNNSFLLKFSLCLKSCSVLKDTQSRREAF